MRKNLVWAVLFFASIALSPVSASPALNRHQILSGSMAARVVPPVAAPPAQGKPPDKIRADVAADIAAYWPTIQAHQNTYRAANGQFWQGLHSHSTRPKNGVRETPDQLDNHPTDQAESWRAAWDGLGPREWRGRVDVYESPQGPGWVLTIELELTDGVWARSWNDGPEAWRATDWVTVTP